MVLRGGLGNSEGPGSCDMELELQLLLLLLLPATCALPLSSVGETWGEPGLRYPAAVWVEAVAYVVGPVLFFTYTFLIATSVCAMMLRLLLRSCMPCCSSRRLWLTLSKPAWITCIWVCWICTRSASVISFWSAWGLPFVLAFTFPEEPLPDVPRKGSCSWLGGTTAMSSELSSGSTTFTTISSFRFTFSRPGWWDGPGSSLNPRGVGGRGKAEESQWGTSWWDMFLSTKHKG